MFFYFLRPVECPACFEPVLDKRDHYGRDFVASKQMRNNFARCKVCSEELRMSDLREHMQECGGQGAEVKPKLIPFVKLQILEQENEPVLIECPFKLYGCQFQGTQAEVDKHLQEVPAAKTCFRARLLDSAVKAAMQQAQEMDALLQQIQQLQELQH
ncbi:uncharacterized protein LOC119741936 isoform X1 [Patiria miniata]|uniref:Uncharacterized protein n=1 Tax=Patiria miniata TaxID=46514 RepID=A0A914BDA2_PATMI|nr:uncharacterized protein LOC119741936 isoform X1 [Patiria miniata]